MKGLFVASTGQNIGKTTICLGLYSGLQKRFQDVGFLKPVGQEWVLETGNRVDKDILLFRSRFNLNIPHEDMSPVLLPKGFTRDYLDGKIDSEELKKMILSSFERLKESFPLTLIEGTGHMGVGSIINLNNAEVAKALNVPMVLVAPGGVGFSFDQIALNKALCDLNGVKLLGVILNKVIPEKMPMVKEYVTKALQRWNLPLLGTIPFDPLLSTPTLSDFASLFNTDLIAGEEEALFHFEKVRMVSTGVDVFEGTLTSDQLIITHSTREDIILATLSEYFESKGKRKLAMILTGPSPRPPIIDEIKKANLPSLVTSCNSFKAMKMISSFTAKIGRDDLEKIDEAIQVVEQGIDFETLVQNL